MSIKSFFASSGIVLFISCGTMYQPSTSNSIQTTIDHIKASAKSYHGKHKKTLILNWGQPTAMSKIDDMEIYQYLQGANLSSGHLAIQVDMLIERDTVIGSTVKPSINYNKEE